MGQVCHRRAPATTYAWIMTLGNGQVVDGTAFYDSISFNELWKIAPVEA